MRVSSIQMDVELGRPKANMEKAAELVEKAMKDKPDVIVLPETWNVGFLPKNYEELADVEGKDTIALLSRLAKKFEVNIIGGSVVNKLGNMIYNTSYSFDRQGKVIAAYNKIHLFSPSREHEYFEHGKELCTFELDGVKAGLIICYDLRFPELARSLALQGVQILFVPAEWPHPRSHHWRILALARAIENQMFVVAVNGAGRTPKAQYCGNSLIIDPWGELIADAGEGEKIITGNLDLSVIKDIRERINVFRDRKPEAYKL